jgi:nucleoside-diphosphate-sugar epimerase
VYLVTGGAGFIGSHIVDELVQRGERVRVLDNLTTGRRENLASALGAIELIEGDIRDLDAVRRAVNGVEYLLHEAALVSVPQSMVDPVTAHAVNVTGTLNVLLAAREAQVRRVVLASSCAVYGDNPDLPLTENVVPRPLSPYAASKQISEVYARIFAAAYGLPTVCLRYFNVYGARQNPNGDYAAVIPKFMTRMRAGEPPIVFGNGKQTRDFVHVSDIVRANLLACVRAEAAGQVFNVASSRQTSLLELVDQMNRLLGTAFRPEFRPERPGDIRHSVGSAALADERLGFRVQMSLLEGLSRL